MLIQDIHAVFVEVLGGADGDRIVNVQVIVQGGYQHVGEGLGGGMGLQPQIDVATLKSGALGEGGLAIARPAVE